MRLFKSFISMGALALTLTACGIEPVADNIIAQGEIVHLRKNGLVLKEKDNVTFIDGGPKTLKQLKKGEKIKILGKVIKATGTAKDNQRDEYEMYEIIKENGKRIKL